MKSALSGAPFKWCPGHVPYLPYRKYATVSMLIIAMAWYDVYVSLIWLISFYWYKQELFQAIQVQHIGKGK